jgi:ATP-dependent RNA helicase DeaD
MTEFQGVAPALNEALVNRGYTALTEVQNAVLLPELKDEDLLVSAQTGSGKTVAFGLAIASTLLKEAETFGKAPQPLALVIAPTRELAVQVTRELEWLYQPSGAMVASCVGGMDIRRERDALARGPHIVVGTPGRLRDHIERGYLDPGALEAVVLDEADEMLDMGFQEELQYILETAPEERRTLLFSATVPKSIASLAKRYQRDAKRITTKGEENQHGDIEYQAFTIAPNDRENAIINLLRYHDAQNAIIFCATRAAVNLLTSRLTNRGFQVVALSGELSQNERTHALQALRDGRAQVCVATDVASRGIDLPGLALVIHADIPKKPDILLHRSGRTGRAGSKGVSVLVVPHQARSRTERLLRDAKVEVEWGTPPSIEDITQRDHERFMAHPALNDAVTEEEQPVIDELLERFTPTQIAAALLRVHNTRKPAPEEMLDAAPQERPVRGDRSAFENSVWISLSAGRNVNAEPRWILPMICGAGNITKHNIGAIKIDQNETFIELTADCVDTFFEAVAPNGKIEKDVFVKRLEGVPDVSKDGGARPRRSFDDKKKPYRDEKRPARSGSKPASGDRKKPFRDDAKPGRSTEGKPKRSFDDKKKPPYERKRPDRDASDGKPSYHDKKKPYRDDAKPGRNTEGKPKRSFDDKKKSPYESKRPYRDASDARSSYSDKKKPYRDDAKPHKGAEGRKKPAFDGQKKPYKADEKPDFKRNKKPFNDGSASERPDRGGKPAFKKKAGGDSKGGFKGAGKAGGKPPFKAKPTKITLKKPKPRP